MKQANKNLCLFEKYIKRHVKSLGSQSWKISDQVKGGE